MEISNNQMQTSQVDNLNQPSEEDPQATKTAKKSGVATEFDGALMASLMGTPAVQTRAPEISPEAMQAAKEAVALAAQEIASAKTQQNAVATSEESGNTKVVVPAQDKALVTQAKQSAAGSITGAFIAGPNQPWSSQWVFGAERPKEPTAETKGPSSALEALRALVMEAGGDEIQPQQTASQTASPKQSQVGVQQAASKALESLDSDLSELRGNVQGLSLGGAEAQVAKPVVQSAPSMTSLSGAEFLNTLQGVRSDGKQQQSGSEMSGEGNSREDLSQKARAAGTPVKRDFQLIEGGLAQTGSNSLQSLGDRKLGNSRSGAEELTLGTSVQNLMQPEHKVGPPPPTLISGQVVPGSMMRERLATDSLHNMSNSIRGMGAAGGGEMKIKLNPGNLGELTIRVSTNGSQVGLQVQASDHAAKRVLEESMNSLKDSLASQNLALGRVDISIAQPSQSLSSDMNSQHNLNQQSSMNWGNSDTSDGGRGSARSQDSSYADGTTGRGRTNANAASAFTRQSRAAADAGRLDVMA